MVHRKYYLAGMVLFLFLPGFLISQNAAEIIAKHIQAHGGYDKWDQVQSLKLAGKFTAFSVENDFTCYKTKAGHYYADLYLGEHRVKEAFMVDDGWTIDPWQDINHARKLSQAEKNVFMQKAEFFTPFYHYKEKGYELVYEGLDTIDGIELFNFTLTRANGKKESWFLDTKTYLEYFCVSEWVDFAWPSKSEVYFDDFRSVDGLIVPFFSDRTFGQRNRVLQIESIEINPTIDSRLFSMPEKVELAKLDHLLGEWDVAVETWTGRGNWYKLGNTTSTIRYTGPNFIEEKIKYERILPISKTINYSFHDIGKNYRITVFNELFATIDVFEGSFQDSSFVFEDTNIRFGEKGSDPQTRYVIRPMGTDQFQVEINQSTDKGKTWNPGDRFTYSRKNGTEP